MFAHCLKKLKNNKYFFKIIVAGLVNAPQLFKFCVTQGQLVEQDKNWSYKILSISQPG